MTACIQSGPLCPGNCACEGMARMMKRTTYQTIWLARGSHRPGEGRGCVMEVVSLLYGEPWSARPACVCPALRIFAATYNDQLGDHERDILLPYAVRLGETNDGGSEERLHRIAEWAEEIAALALPDTLPQRFAREASKALADSPPYRLLAADHAVTTASITSLICGRREIFIERPLALLDELCPPTPAGQIPVGQPEASRSPREPPNPVPDFSVGRS